MRVAVIADIHANLHALQALEPCLANADRILFLGDLIGYYCQVNEVCEWIRAAKAICVRGNHDHYLIHGAPDNLPESVQFGLDFARSVIEPTHLRWLASLPLVWGAMLDGRAVLAVHGSPWDPISGYLYADSPRLGELSGFHYDWICFGQTHRPLLAAGPPGLLNPGSVGQSRHEPGVACAAIVDTKTNSVTLEEHRYDPEPVIQLAQQHGAGAWILKHLR